MGEFIEKKMNIETRELDIERAHIIGKYYQGKDHMTLVKFLNYKDNEVIRKEAPRRLRNSKYGINEQYPKEILDRRRLRVQVLKEH